VAAATVAEVATTTGGTPTLARRFSGCRGTTTQNVLAKEELDLLRRARPDVASRSDTD
jgi:hypothetical protein